MTVNRGFAWDSCQPILLSLPGLFQAYTENECVEVLVDYWDELYCGTKTKIDDMDRQLNPQTCDEEYLPLLGYVAGFSGNYAILDCFDVACQREIISRSHSFVWAFKGSRPVLDFLLGCLGINYTYYEVKDFLVGINAIGDSISSEGEELINYYLVPSSYERNGAEWSKITKIVELFTPISASNIVSYEHFIIGEGAMGDVIFD